MAQQVNENPCYGCDTGWGNTSGQSCQDTCERYIEYQAKEMDIRVNHPQHYTTGKIECIDYIQDKLTPEEFRGFIKGNVIKYLTREKHKNGVEDLKKAKWYLDRLIEGDNSNG